MFSYEKTANNTIIIKNEEDRYYNCYLLALPWLRDMAQGQKLSKVDILRTTPILVQWGRCCCRFEITGTRHLSMIFVCSVRRQKDYCEIKCCLSVRRHILHTDRSTKASSTGSNSYFRFLQEVWHKAWREWGGLSYTIMDTKIL